MSKGEHFLRENEFAVIGSAVTAIRRW